MIMLSVRAAIVFLLPLAVGLLMERMAVGEEKAALVRIGHRGAPTLAPENTVAGVRAALEAGVDGVEFDIKHYTADHEMIVLHDPNLDRTTNGGKAKVTEKTLAELRALDAGNSGSWASSKFAGEKLPLPEEMLREILAGGAFPVIHIETPNQVADVMRVVTETNALEKVVIFCFDYSVMEKLAKEHPAVRKGWLVGDDNLKSDTVAGIVAKAAQAKCTVLAPCVSMVTPELTAACHGAKLPVWTWTVNDEAQMAEKICQGVDGIITDAPQLLNAVLARRAGFDKE